MDVTITPADHTSTTQDPRPRYGRVGLVAGLGASAATVAVAAIASALDVSLDVDGEAIPVLGFAQVTFLATIVGIALAAAFMRWARRPRRTFVVATVALTALSLVPPLSVPADTATKVVLELTHVVAALIVIPAIASRLTDRAPVR